MKQRIIAIDVLRGIALLGILLMNISSFAMPNIAYFNPTVYGGDGIGNRLLFGLSHIFADQKMMAVFSILFGASVMLVTNNMEKRGESSLVYYYSRNFWLLIIGLMHSILLWDGDILVIYALCSFVLYWLRRVPPRWQLALGLSIFFIPSIFALWAGTAMPYLETADINYLESFWQPSQAEIAAEIDLYRDPYMAQLEHRAGFNSVVLTYTDGQGILELSMLIEFFGRALGMMLVGMAFYTWGVLTAKRSEEFYTNMALVGFGLGLPIALISLFQYTAHNWNAIYSLFNGRILNHVATPLIAGGFIALVMLWIQSDFLKGLQDRLAAVGRMALSNYIGQSLIATFIFYGFGLGLFGMFTRVQNLFVILLIWLIQIMLSSWWLERYQYGPLEWVWRMLSRRRWQLLKKRLVRQAY